MNRLVVTDQSFGVLPEASAVAERLGIVLESHQARTEQETMAVTAGADAVLVQYAPITRAVLAGLAPGATVVRYGIGYDNIDVVAARELGVRVAAVPDYGVDTVADHATALLLSAMRRVVIFDRALRERRRWVDPGSVGPVPSLGSSTVGLIGTGRIGTAVARRLAGFGTTMVAFDPYADQAVAAEAGVRLVALDELLAISDAVSLHAPLTPETHHIIDAAALARLRPTAVLVNTARGPLVDTVALAEALASGRLAAAALDVVDPEPLPADSPLWDAPNLVLTPHVSFYSIESLVRLEALAAQEAERALRGEPLRCPVP